MNLCLTDLGVVVCEELTDEFGVLVVDDQVLVSADGTGVAPTHLAVHDAFPPGPGVTVSGISKVPTVELPDLAITIPVFFSKQQHLKTAQNLRKQMVHLHYLL